MSALLPKADMCSARGMSAKGHKQTLYLTSLWQSCSFQTACVPSQIFWAAKWSDILELRHAQRWINLTQTRHGNLSPVHSPQKGITCCRNARRAREVRLLPKCFFRPYCGFVVTASNKVSKSNHEMSDKCLRIEWA